MRDVGIATTPPRRDEKGVNRDSRNTPGISPYMPRDLKTAPAGGINERTPNQVSNIPRGNEVQRNDRDNQRGIGNPGYQPFERTGTVQPMQPVPRDLNQPISTPRVQDNARPAQDNRNTYDRTGAGKVNDAPRERLEKIERVEKIEKPVEKIERPGKIEKIDRPERVEKIDRNDRPGNNDRARSDRERNDNNAKDKRERMERSDNNSNRGKKG